MKKITALFLASAMTMGLLAGCGGGSSSSSSSSSTSSTGSSSSSSSTGADSSSAASDITTIVPGKLTVAISPDFAPMEFVDASKSGQDQYVGFDPSLAKYIAENMGLELEISPMSFDACQVAVSMGSVDMSISGFSWTEAREENYNLSDFYHAGDNEDGQTLICMKTNEGKYADAPNMEGLKVGFQGASLQEVLVNDQLTKCVQVPYQDITTGVMQLRNGDFEVMAVADGNATAIIAANPDVALAGFQFYVDPKQQDNLILLQKGNDELTAKVNEILAKAVSENKYPGWYDEAKALAGIETAQEISYDDQGKVAG